MAALAFGHARFAGRQLRENKMRLFSGLKEIFPTGQHWALQQKRIDELTAQGDIRINPKKRYVDTEGNQIVGMPEYRKEPYLLLNDKLG